MSNLDISLGKIRKNLILAAGTISATPSSDYVITDGVSPGPPGGGGPARPPPSFIRPFDIEPNVDNKNTPSSLYVITNGVGGGGTGPSTPRPVPTPTQTPGKGSYNGDGTWHGG